MTEHAVTAAATRAQPTSQRAQRGVPRKDRWGAGDRAQAPRL